jgi:hypothetical protein
MRVFFSLFICGAILAFNSACNDAVDKGSADAKQESTALSDTIKDEASASDTVKHSFDNYTIAVVPHKGEIGEAVIVEDKKQNRSFTVDEGDTYYVDVVDSFLLIDAGTSSLRRLKVVDLNNNKIVFEGSYYDKLDIKEKKIIFKAEVSITEEARKPKCPDAKNKEYNGFLEEQVLDLTNLRLVKTGKYECAYFE